MNKKNQRAFDSRIYAKPWLSANKIPYSSDRTNAWYRRNIIIATPNTFDVKKDPLQRIKKMDVNLLQKLTIEEEKSGIFNLLMTFLRLIRRSTSDVSTSDLKNKEIYVSARTIEERRRKYLLAADPIGAFIDEAVKLVIDENEPKTTTKDIMYIAYSEFCSIKRISAIEKETFGKGVSKRFQWQDDLERDGKTVRRIWLNKRLTPEYEKIANDAIKRIRLKYGQETLEQLLRHPRKGRRHRAHRVH